MGKKKTQKIDRDTSEIQDSGNVLLDNVLEGIRKKFVDIKIIKTSEEHQKDRGVDFQVELVGKPRDETFDMLKLQVKATDKALAPLKNTTNKGLFSFQLSNRHIRYYQNEMPWPLLFILCDVPNQKVYWHAIQLDDSLEERVNKSEVKKNNSIQIFIDPNNLLGPETFLNFVRDARESKQAQFFRVSDEKLSPLIDSQDFRVDRNKPLLDQLFDLLEYLYEEITYLPLYLLTHHYPFKTSERFTPYYHWFKLHIENDQLVEMLASFEVQPNGGIKFCDTSFIDCVDDYENKAKAIMRKLMQNHIYWLVSEKTGKEVLIKFFAHTNCDCVACLYNRLDIPGAIRELSKRKKEKLEDQVKTAYMHYVLGNYLKAADDFLRIANLANKARKRTLYLIAQFNLIRLGRLIKNNYYDKESSDLAKKLMSIKLDPVVYSATNRSHHRKLLIYIKELRFYNDNAFEIQYGSRKLRDDYQNFLKGNNFTTHNYNQMLNGFAQLHSFVNGNHIVYDRYGEYQLQLEEFTEGIFAALALRETNSYVITEFIEYHIQRLIFDGDHKVTWRYFNKYLFRSIPYKQTDEDYFIKLIINLLSNNHLVKSIFEEYSPEEGKLWRTRYPEIFCNCLCVAAIIEMDNDRVETITRAIMKCLAAADLPSPDAYQQVNSFFSSKQKQLSSELLHELIGFFLPYGDLYLQARLGIFTAELKVRKETIKLTQNQEQQILDYAFSERDPRHFNTVAFFFPVVEQPLREKIIAQIISSLREKFDVYNFYYAAVNDILPFQNSEFCDQFVVATFPDPNKYSFRSSLYGPEDNCYPLFDMLFNLCFKYDLLPTQLADRDFMGHGAYYDWLLNIDGFDYKKFKISWLGLYPTKFYFKEFRKHAVVKEQLESYLCDHRDLRAERLYIDIFNPALDNGEPNYEE